VEVDQTTPALALTHISSSGISRSSTPHITNTPSIDSGSPLQNVPNALSHILRNALLLLPSRLPHGAFRPLSRLAPHLTRNSRHNSYSAIPRNHYHLRPTKTQPHSLHHSASLKLPNTYQLFQHGHAHNIMDLHSHDPNPTTAENQKTW